MSDFLFLITARGGSKGVPGKNIKKLANKPLIYYTIDAARGVTSDDKICVSTDSPEIKKIVEKYDLEVPFLRPSELATDQANSYGVIKHALGYYKNIGIHFDSVVLLQPTSPFRTTKHIKEAISLYKKDLDIVISVKEADANPYYLLYEEDETGWIQISKEGRFTRRQDCPKVYQINGAVYVINCESLRKYNGISEFPRKKKYVMEKIHSIDIDDMVDWYFCESVMEKKLIEVN